MNTFDAICKWFLVISMATFVIALNVVLMRVVNDLTGRL